MDSDQPQSPQSDSIIKVIIMEKTYNNGAVPKTTDTILGGSPAYGLKNVEDSDPWTNITPTDPNTYLSRAQIVEIFPTVNRLGTSKD
jgi:hypothetical protein